jgi:hypothetical protein
MHVGLYARMSICERVRGRGMSECMHDCMMEVVRLGAVYWWPTRKQDQLCCIFKWK